MFIHLFGCLLWSAAGGLLLWLLQGREAMAWGAWLGAVVWAVQQLWRAHRLEAWFRAGPQGDPPRLAGVWREISDRIRRALQQRDKQVLAQSERLRQFLDAIQASPNGVTLLDSEGRIAWCNSAASQHLGLDAQRDQGQHVVHLVREPVFSRYFHQASHEGEVQMEGRSASISRAVKLSVQLYPYGDGQQLLLTRDITAMAQADSMRRDFVANVSHEMRTPITVLMGFLETVQTLDLQKDQQDQYFDLMMSQAQRMKSLVEDLLTLANLESNTLPASISVVKIETLMALLKNDAEALSQGRHAIEFELSSPMNVLGEEREVHSAFSNLVSNAIRYTPDLGSIKVTWSVNSQGQGEFLVKDSGPGIASEHLPRLTERFYRVDRSRSRDTGGTGLGLAIVKHIASRHQAQLIIESAPGNGSAFMLRFPKERIATS